MECAAGCALSKERSPSENLARCLLGFDLPFPRRQGGLTEDAESSGGRGGFPGRPASPAALNFCRLASDATLCSFAPSGNPAQPEGPALQMGKRTAVLSKIPELACKVAPQPFLLEDPV